LHFLTKLDNIAVQMRSAVQTGTDISIKYRERHPGILSNREPGPVIQQAKTACNLTRVANPTDSYLGKDRRETHLAAEDRKSLRAKSQNKNNRRYATSPTPQTYLTDAQRLRRRTMEKHTTPCTTLEYNTPITALYTTLASTLMHTQYPAAPQKNTNGNQPQCGVSGRSTGT